MHTLSIKLLSVKPPCQVGNSTVTYDRLYKGQADVSTLFIKPVPYKLQLPRPFSPVPCDAFPTYFRHPKHAVINHAPHDVPCQRSSVSRSLNAGPSQWVQCRWMSIGLILYNRTAELDCGHAEYANWSPCFMVTRQELSTASSLEPIN
jgi:hypothetical protein